MLFFLFTVNHYKSFILWMNISEMSVLNDDGVPLDLRTVLILFLMPNFALIILTSFNAYLLYVSKTRPRLKRLLGKLANFFAKGALDRIIRNILQRLEIQKVQNEEQISLHVQKRSHTSKNVSASSSFNSMCEKIYDANYLLLVPFQIDLLLTVFVYKILTRDVYFETCHSYLTTYHNRPLQVVCWLKNINITDSNQSINATIYQYCTNQPVTYINYEHNDVICTQYVFKLINIIDTVTNIFAWHQAVVFVVTKYIVFTHWYQQKLRKILRQCNLFDCQRRIILFVTIYFALFTYILVFVILLPIRFVLLERRRVDLTHHLFYACSKFFVGIIIHVNLYTIYQWHSFIKKTDQTSIRDEKQKVFFDRLAASNVSIPNSIYATPADTMIVGDYLRTIPKIYLTPDTPT